MLRGAARSKAATRGSFLRAWLSVSCRYLCGVSFLHHIRPL